MFKWLKQFPSIQSMFFRETQITLL